MGNCKSNQKPPEEILPAGYDVVKNSDVVPLMPSKESGAVSIKATPHGEVEASQTDLTLADSNVSSVNPAQADASPSTGDEGKASYLQFDPNAEDEEDEEELLILNDDSADIDSSNEEKEENEENENHQIVPSAKSSETYHMVIPIENAKQVRGSSTAVITQPDVVPTELSKQKSQQLVVQQLPRPSPESPMYQKRAFPVLKGKPELGSSLDSPGAMISADQSKQKSKWALSPRAIVNSNNSQSSNKSNQWALGPEDMPDDATHSKSEEKKKYLAIKNHVEEQPQTAPMQKQRRSRREDSKRGDGSKYPNGAGYPPNFMANW